MGRRLAEAERLADHDVLTPLLNRRAFVRELQRAHRPDPPPQDPGQPDYFDLDDFKLINDHYGHAAGDAVLIAVAERLTSDVRQATWSDASAATSSRCCCSTPTQGRQRQGRRPDRGRLQRADPLRGP